MLSKAELAEEQKILDNIRKEIFGTYATKPKKTENKGNADKKQCQIEKVYTALDEVPVVVEYKIIRDKEKGLKTRGK